MRTCDFCPSDSVIVCEDDINVNCAERRDLGQCEEHHEYVARRVICTCIQINGY